METSVHEKNCTFLYKKKIWYNKIYILPVTNSQISDLCVLLLSLWIIEQMTLDIHSSIPTAQILHLFLNYWFLSPSYPFLKQYIPFSMLAPLPTVHHNSTQWLKQSLLGDRISLLLSNIFTILSTHLPCYITLSPKELISSTCMPKYV